MARYNREFLIPYLQNICALYQALRRIDQEYNQCWNEVYQSERMTRPTYPYYEEEKMGCSCYIPLILSLFFGVCTILITGEKTGLGRFSFASFAFLVITIVSAIIFVSIVRATKAGNEALESEHKRQVAEYAPLLRAYENSKRRIPTLRAKMEKLKAEANKVRDLIQKLYSVNIIPGRYRDIYGAFYLYDWFGTSQADDMDMALNTYVLEQIRDRLDTVIANQAEMIMNQRISHSLQFQAIEEQRGHAARMEARAKQIATGIEEQNIYLQMIQQETAAMTYFAAADYLQK